MAMIDFLRDICAFHSLTLGIDDFGSDRSTCGPEGEIESLDFVDLIDLGREETMSVIVPKGL